MVFKEYAGLFNEERSDDDPIPARPGQSKPTSPARNWWLLLNGLAGENPAGFETAAKLPVRFAFNWLAWKKDEVKKHNLAVQSQQKHNLR